MGIKRVFYSVMIGVGLFAVALIAVALVFGPESAPSSENVELATDEPATAPTKPQGANPADETEPDADQSKVNDSETGDVEAGPDPDVGMISSEPPLVTDRPLWVDPASAGRAWSALGAVDGLLTFRGNPTRTYDGGGPVPKRPSVIWEYNIGCSNSSVGSEDKEWCGTGWTGQPVVFPAPSNSSNTNPAWWVAFGAYNRAVNVLAADSGQEVIEPIVTGDIIKGSVTADPDGYPLLYSGSRDNFFRVIAIDGGQARELWRLEPNEHGPTLWNNDWDGSALVVDDYLLVGGENSRFYVVKLNRDYGDDGSVMVEPEVVFSGAGWDEQLLAEVGDAQASIENSVVLVGSVLFFANSAGLVQGWDLAAVPEGGEPVRVFRYWVGDDVDATLVPDDAGGLYVAVEYERGNARARELGQLIKLDIGAVTADSSAGQPSASELNSRSVPASPVRPENPAGQISAADPVGSQRAVGTSDDPLIWTAELQVGLDSGVWATPALWGEVVIVPTDDGRVIGLDQATGSTVWTLELPGPLWSSPVVVDDVLVQGDCAGQLNAFDLTDEAGNTLRKPTLRWRVQLEGCVESTPALWNGTAYVGTRGGTFYAIADR